MEEAFTLQAHRLKTKERPRKWEALEGSINVLAHSYTPMEGHKRDTTAILSTSSLIHVSYVALLIWQFSRIFSLRKFLVFLEK